MSVIIDPALAMVIRAGLVVLLGGAVIHKLRSLRGFHASVRGFGLVPAGLLGAVVIGVPIGEAVTVLLLALRPAVGGPAAAALLGVYAAAMALALAGGRRGVDCGCGGPAGTQPLQGGLIVRNVLLAGAALLLAAPVGARALAWLDVVTIAGGVAATTVLFVAANTVLATTPRIRDLERGAEVA